MPDIVTGLTVGGSLVTSYLSSKEQKSAAGEAAGFQVGAAEAGISETRGALDSITELLKPYTEAGTGALEETQALLGVGGRDQGAAIEAIKNSPEFQELIRSGEEAILSRASATGGIRGGNVQAALAEFRPAILNELINKRFGRLRGLTNLGQSSAVTTGSAGLQAGRDISTLLGERGAAQSGEALARGQANVKLFGDIGKGIGTVAGGL